MDLLAFGQRLVAERERLGLKAVDVYTHLDIHRNSQSQYERGIKEPGISYLMGLMSLGFDVVWLLSGDDQSRATEVLNDDERTLLCAYRSLPPTTKLLVHQLTMTLAEPPQGGSAMQITAGS